MMSHEMSQVIAYLLFSVTCRMSPNFLRPFYFQCTKTEKSLKSKSYWNLSCFCSLSTGNDLDESQKLQRNILSYLH